jgi:ABC-type uncharacterized transport system substrate-binding protein
MMPAAGGKMRRRDFFSLLGGSAVALAPHLTRAQQAPDVYRIAIVSPTVSVAEMSETGGTQYRAFLGELRRLGYVEGRNLAIARYSGVGLTGRYAELVGEVIRGHPDVLCAATTRLTLEFKAATNTIPMVSVVEDPIADGIVTSLARPGGNITGTTVAAGLEIWGKRLELLRELLPAASRIGYLASRRAREKSPTGAAVREAARSMKISLVGPPLEPPFEEAEFRRAFAAMVGERANALIVNDQSENLANRRLIVDLAAQAGLPAIYPYSGFVEHGGLMAYAPDITDVFRHAADAVAEILKGTKAGDIPFYQATKFGLAINLKTAKTLAIEIPDSILAQAEEVIE